MGFWSRELTRNEIWGSDRWRALLGFTKAGRVHYEDFSRGCTPTTATRCARRWRRRSTVTGATRRNTACCCRTEQRAGLPRRAASNLAGIGRPARLQGVVLDITQRKQAELEAQEHRGEVAHLLRAASLGELSSALAHELNQPLAAILYNAQAAQLFLARGDFDLEEIRHILGDIVTDDQRASEVIRRLRALLTKGEFQPQAVGRERTDSGSAQTDES